MKKKIFITFLLLISLQAQADCLRNFQNKTLIILAGIAAGAAGIVDADDINEFLENAEGVIVASMYVTGETSNIAPHQEKMFDTGLKLLDSNLDAGYFEWSLKRADKMEIAKIIAEGNISGDLCQESKVPLLSTIKDFVKSNL